MNILSVLAPKYFRGVSARNMPKISPLMSRKNRPRTTKICKLPARTVFVTTPFEEDWCDFYVRSDDRASSVWVTRATDAKNVVLAIQLSNFSIATFIPDAEVVPLGVMDGRETLAEYKKRFLKSRS